MLGCFFFVWNIGIGSANVIAQESPTIESYRLKDHELTRISTQVEALGIPDFYDYKELWAVIEDGSFDQTMLKTIRVNIIYDVHKTEGQLEKYYHVQCVCFNFESDWDCAKREKQIEKGTD